MLNKILLYCRTIRHLKIEQILYQVLMRMGCSSSLNKNLIYESGVKEVVPLSGNRVLNYDEDFIKRFCVDDLMQNKLTILYESENLIFGKPWTFVNKSPLWNHNAHYFEYIFSLAKRYEESREDLYLYKIKKIILSWIEDNEIGVKNSSWACYPVALRLSNWIDLYSILYKEIVQDKEFNLVFLNSLYCQYVFLVQHLEKHLLANHYFEDLRSIVIGSIFFKDKDTFEIAIKELINQCSEQILEDGFQYERSPMYQKILLEDLIKVVNALLIVGEDDYGLKDIIQKMIDVSYSLEDGLDRIPLFNDCGNNIAKSLNSLVIAASNIKIFPNKKNDFVSSGFYIYRFGKNTKSILILDAGQPGPSYSPGHAHNELMSYELFVGGKPVIVNCGTYAYQSKYRMMYKSTSSHNTVKVSRNEQSEFWSSFRLARRATITKVEYNKNSIYMEMLDYKNNSISRFITIDNDSINIVDRSVGNEIESFIHCKDGQLVDIDIESGMYEMKYSPYSKEFGLMEKVLTYFIKGAGEIRYSIHIKG